MLNINSGYMANNLSYAQSLTEKSMNRLSSAKRINSAADDAAGLAIVSGMMSQMGSNQVAQRNTSDGISAIQIAEGGLSGITDSLQRMRELAVESQNGSLNASDRQNLNQEFDQLSQANDQMVQQSNFNGQKLLSVNSSFNIQTGTNAGNTTSISLNDSTNNGLGLNGLDITTSANAGNALNAIDSALSKIGQKQSVFGASQSNFESNISKANVLDKAAMYAQVQQQQSQKNILNLFA